MDIDEQIAKLRLLTEVTQTVWGSH